MALEERWWSHEMCTAAEIPPCTLPLVLEPYWKITIIKPTTFIPNAPYWQTPKYDTWHSRDGAARPFLDRWLHPDRWGRWYAAAPDAVLAIAVAVDNDSFYGFDAIVFLFDATEKSKILFHPGGRIICCLSCCLDSTYLDSWSWGLDLGIVGGIN